MCQCKERREEDASQQERLPLSKKIADVDLSLQLLTRAPAGFKPLAVLQGESINPKNPYMSTTLKM